MSYSRRISSPFFLTWWNSCDILRIGILSSSFIVISRNSKWKRWCHLDLIFHSFDCFHSKWFPLMIISMSNDSHDSHSVYLRLMDFLSYSPVVQCISRIVIIFRLSEFCNQVLSGLRIRFLLSLCRLSFKMYFRKRSSDSRSANLK